MSDLLEMITGQLMGGGTVSQLAKRIGASDKATSQALGGAVPMLLQGLAGNTERSGGANALAAALDRDHDGSILDDLGGFLGSGSTSTGDGILRHVLGDRRGQAESSLGKLSGLDTGQISKLLSLVAPLVLGFLGKEKRSQGLDAGMLGSLLGSTRESISQREPQLAGMLGSLLDADGDGSAMDEVADIGKGLLGRLFRRKR
jgi:hypothetical protein